MGDSSTAEHLIDAEFGDVEGDEIALPGGKSFTKQRFGHLVDLTDIKGRYRHGSLVDETVLAVGYLALQVEVGEAVIALPGSTPPSTPPVAGATPVFVRTAAAGP